MAFVSPRYRATCSIACYRERRQRQYRLAAQNRSDASKARDMVRKTSVDARNAHAAAEREARAAGKRTKPAPDNSRDAIEKRRAYARSWWKTDAAQRLRDRRNERAAAMRDDPVRGAAMREKGRLEQQERRRRRALMETTRIYDERTDDDAKK